MEPTDIIRLALWRKYTHTEIGQRDNKYNGITKEQKDSLTTRKTVIETVKIKKKIKNDLMNQLVTEMDAFLSHIYGRGQEDRIALKSIKLIMLHLCPKGKIGEPNGPCVA